VDGSNRTAFRSLDSDGAVAVMPAILRKKNRYQLEEFTALALGMDSVAI
jgi:hypothetical protein